MAVSPGQVPVPRAAPYVHVSCDLVNIVVIVFLWESFNAIQPPSFPLRAK